MGVGIFPRKKMENGHRPDMTEKWLSKWTKNGRKSHSGVHFFHFGSQFLAISGLGPFSIIFPIFPAIFASGRFPIL